MIHWLSSILWLIIRTDLSLKATTTKPMHINNLHSLFHLLLLLNFMLSLHLFFISGHNFLLFLVEFLNFIKTFLLRLLLLTLVFIFFDLLESADISCIHLIAFVVSFLQNLFHLLSLLMIQSLLFCTTSTAASFSVRI